MAMLDLRTKELNLSGIPAGAGVASSQQSAIYDGPNTIYWANLHCTIAGVAATDAQIDAQIGNVEVKDNETILISRDFTPLQLRGLYNHWHAKDAAWPADTGDIPIPLVPDYFPYRGQTSYYGLGRKSEDGKRSTFKITLTYLTPVSIDLVIPTLTLDLTETDVALGKHIRLSQFVGQAFAGTGDRPETEVFRNMSPISCHELLWNTATGTLTQFTVRRDNDMIMDHIPVMALARQAHRAGFTAMANRAALHFNQNNDPTSALPLIGNPMVTITPTWGVAPAGNNGCLRVLEYNGHAAA